MLEAGLVGDVLDEALARGADFAEVFVEESRRLTFRYIDRSVKECLSGCDVGAGVRVLYGARAGYAYTSDLSRDSLLASARAAAAAGKNGGAAARAKFGRARSHEAGGVEVSPAAADLATFVDFARGADEAARGADEFVTQVTVSIGGVDRTVQVATSEGALASERRVYFRPMVQAIATKGAERQTGYEKRDLRAGAEALAGLDPADIGREAARIAGTMVRAPHAPAGVMPVVIGNAFGGVIFHEACGHALETTAVSRSASVFAGKIGELVASECVTAIDDGTLPNMYGSTAIDDEGAPTARTVLIERGVLRSYLSDRLGEIKTGAPRTGSGRRQDYRHAPTSRMRNTFIDAGDAQFDAMLAAASDNGKIALYAKRMGGGSVNPGTGDFNFAVLEGYLIKGGKVAGPVRGASLIGRGHEVLKRIALVGDDLALDGGTCGSLSGWVPTCVGQPTILVSEIVVGGREAKA